MLNEKIICAGFGGQGVMSMGQLLAYAGMIEDKHVTWLPSYGPEMRGGTAYCSVMLSDTPVGSPVITGNASCVIVMNLPSLLKFESYVAPGGLLLINSSLITVKTHRRDVCAQYVPANDLAAECGNGRAANMVMLGAYLALTYAAQPANIIEAFKKVFGSKAERILALNRNALNTGVEFIQHQCCVLKKAA